MPTGNPQYVQKKEAIKNFIEKYPALVKEPFSRNMTFSEEWKTYPIFEANADDILFLWFLEKGAECSFDEEL